MSNSHLSLFELNRLIRETLDKNLDPSYWLLAEISELRVNQKGHCYLELVEKEDDKITAKARATIWSYQYRNLSAWFTSMTGEALRPGIKILCNASVEYHELYGFSLNIRDIDAGFTMGEKALKRQETIKRLEKEGFLNSNKVHPLPAVPQNIAVISAPTAAGYEDFVNQLESNPYGYQFNITLYKALMQGDQAPFQISEALMEAYAESEDFDVIIIIRGGGSRTDLDCFDDYEVGKAIGMGPIPVITGIGHERDESVADLCAHTRVKTPTAAAEFLISGLRAFDEKLMLVFENIAYHAEKMIQERKEEVNLIKISLANVLKSRLKDEFYTLNNTERELKIQTQGLLNKTRESLSYYQEHLKTLDPVAVMKRGFSITTINGKTPEKAELKDGTILETETLNFKITSKLIKQKKKQ